MAVQQHNILILSYTFLLLLLKSSSESTTPSSLSSQCIPTTPIIQIPVFPYDIDLLQFALNIEHTEADFFLYGALGKGLDAVAPELVQGGPPPIGAKKANLDKLTAKIIEEFGYQEVGHLRAIKSLVGGFPRPQLDLSATHFAKIFDDAFGYKLNPQFDPYISSLNYLLASYVIPYVGLVAYVGANPNTNGYASKRLLAGLLAVESGQDAVIRAILYEHADEFVPPYKNYTVAEFTCKISKLRNNLAGCGIKDEGILVSLEFGAEHKTHSNVLSADANSVAYDRTPAEILRILYGTGDETKPGGFLPKGGNGAIAQGFLKH